MAHSQIQVPYIEYKKEDFPEDAKKIKLEAQPEFIKDFKAENIFGYVPGTSKKYIVFTAHYDHLGGIGDQVFIPGAQDNASGVAMCLDLARYYVENPGSHNIAVILFAGEEAGLLGSGYFVSHPQLPLEDIDFLINLDMLGTGEKGITVVNGKSEEYADYFEHIQKININNELLDTVKARGISANSDHHPFNEKDVPAVFIYSMGGNTYYHYLKDRPETVSLGKYEEIFTLITKFIESYDW